MQTIDGSEQRNSFGCRLPLQSRTVRRSRAAIAIGLGLAIIAGTSLASCSLGDLLGSTTKYTVSYEPNGATSGSIPVDKNTYAPGDTVSVLGNTGDLEKTGYLFFQWNTRSDDKGTDYTPGAKFAMGKSNVTLYAEWTAAPSFSVTYDANGATGGSVPVDSSTYTAGTNVTVLANTGNLVKSGYTFVGWNATSDGSGTAYTPGSTFTMGSASIVLYAQWTVLATYHVYYDANGATGGSVPVDGNAYLQGATVTVRGNTGSLVRDGYVFAGWNIAADGTGTDYSQGATFAIGTANVTLYAKWAVDVTHWDQSKWDLSVWG